MIKPILDINKLENKVWLPNVIIIGMQRAATSSLYKLFYTNNIFNLSIPKETHFFTRNFHYGFNWYRSCFRPKDNLNEGYLTNYTLDICPDYLTSFHALSRISYLSQSIRMKPILIVITRDKKSITESLIRYRYNRSQIKDYKLYSYLNSNLACELVSEASISSWQAEFPDIIKYSFSKLISQNGVLELLKIIYNSLGISDYDEKLYSLSNSLTLPQTNNSYNKVIIPRPLVIPISDLLIRFSPRFFGKIFS